MKMKKILSALLCLVMLSSMSLALADSSSSRVAIGSDLNEEQINQVYKTFRINRGEVTELTVTNNDERAYLSKSVDTSMIGTKAISCIFIEALNEGSGLNVSTSNISWCTPDTYRNALTTAGITDANVTITAPFSVSACATARPSKPPSTRSRRASATCTKGAKLRPRPHKPALNRIVISIPFLPTFPSRKWRYRSSFPSSTGRCSVPSGA